ncbi:hypothetical protein P0D72_02065 [Paraburkholderia sediminicola]|uniref:hypothetical protein n=1 Tax=Paraburkholderia sediminicola TaxID=458836 RepID=UPI0038BD0759
MQQTDLSKFSDQTTGLPDYWYIDDAGQPSWPHLMSRLRLPRKVRNDRKLFDAHMSRRMRAVGFTVVSSHYRQLETDILLEGDARASWEAHVLSKFDAGWHLRGHQDLSRVQSLPEDVATHFIAEYKKVTKSEIPKTPSEIKRRSDLEIVGRSALESYLKGVEELREWAKQSPERQRELADVMFAGFTLFGKRALEDAVAVEPGLLKFYGAVLGSRPSTRSKFVEDARGAVGDTMPDAVDRALESDGGAVTTMPEILRDHRPLESLGELYTRIGEIAIGAVTSSDGESARQIRALISIHRGLPLLR